MKKNAKNILFLPFKSIYFYLEGILSLVKILPHKSIMIFCAAVSDFIPKEVAEHKIQTKNEMALELCSSPKILGQMVDEKKLCVSFKL